MIYGNGVGEPLVKHPLIQAVGFGSLRGGRALCDMAAARPPIPVFAEMSSINPMLMLPEALKTVVKNCTGFGRFSGFRLWSVLYQSGFNLGN